MGRLYKVVLDSNMLMAPFEFGIDVIEDIGRVLDVKYEVCTTKGALNELESVSKSTGKKGKRAKAALLLTKNIQVIPSEGKTDEALLALASKDVIICTNDKILRKKIREKRLPVIYLRQKKYLMLEGYVG